MNVVAVHLKDGADLLARFRPGEQADELFVPEALDLAVGERLLLHLYFDHSGYGFRVTGRIISRRLSRSEALPPGARVALDVAEEAPLRQMVLAHARGEDIDYRPRTGARVLCRFPVEVRSPLASRGEVIDLSEGGARVVGMKPAPLGATLALKLHPPGAFLSLSISARVVWQRSQPAPAMGIEFQPQRRLTRRRIENLLGRLKAG